MATKVLHGSMAEMLAKVKENTMSKQDLYDIDMKLWKIMSGMQQRTIQQILTHFYRTEGGRSGVDPQIVKNRIYDLKDQGVFQIKACKGFTEYVLVKGKVPKAPDVTPAAKPLKDRDEDRQPMSNASNVFAMRDHYSVAAHTQLPPNLDENFEIVEDTLITPTTQVSTDTTPRTEEELISMSQPTTTVDIEPLPTVSVEVHCWKMLQNGQRRYRSEMVESLARVRNIEITSAKAYMSLLASTSKWLRTEKEGRRCVHFMDPGTPMPLAVSNKTSRTVLPMESCTVPVTHAPKEALQVTDRVQSQPVVAPTVGLVEIVLKIKGIDFTIPEMKELHEVLINANLSDNKGKSSSGLLQTAHVIKGVVFTTQELWEVLEQLDKHM